MRVDRRRETGRVAVKNRAGGRAGGRGGAPGLGDWAGPVSPFLPTTPFRPDAPVGPRPARRFGAQIPARGGALPPLHGLGGSRRDPPRGARALAVVFAHGCSLGNAARERRPAALLRRGRRRDAPDMKFASVLRDSSEDLPDSVELFRLYKQLKKSLKRIPVSSADGADARGQSPSSSVGGASDTTTTEAAMSRGIRSEAALASPPGSSPDAEGSCGAPTGPRGADVLHGAVGAIEAPAAAAAPSGRAEILSSAAAPGGGDGGGAAACPAPLGSGLAAGAVADTANASVESLSAVGGAARDAAAAATAASRGAEAAVGQAEAGGEEEGEECDQRERVGALRADPTCRVAAAGDAAGVRIGAAPGSSALAPRGVQCASDEGALGLDGSWHGSTSGIFELHRTGEAAEAGTPRGAPGGAGAGAGAGGAPGGGGGAAAGAGDGAAGVPGGDGGAAAGDGVLNGGGGGAAAAAAAGVPGDGGAAAGVPGEFVSSGALFPPPSFPGLCPPRASARASSLAEGEAQFVHALTEDVARLNDAHMEREEVNVIRLGGLEEVVSRARTAAAARVAYARAVDLHGELLLSLHWSILAYTGLVKILKKHHKRTGLLVRAPHLADMLSQPFCSVEMTRDMVLRVEAIVAELAGRLKIPSPASTHQGEAQLSGEELAPDGCAKTPEVGGESAGGGGGGDGRSAVDTTARDAQAQARARADREAEVSTRGRARNAEPTAEEEEERDEERDEESGERHATTTTTMAAAAPIDVGARPVSSPPIATTSADSSMGGGSALAQAAEAARDARARARAFGSSPGSGSGVGSGPEEAAAPEAAQPSPEPSPPSSAAASAPVSGGGESRQGDGDASAASAGVDVDVDVAARAGVPSALPARRAASSSGSARVGASASTSTSTSAARASGEPSGASGASRRGLPRRAEKRPREDEGAVGDDGEPAAVGRRSRGADARAASAEAAASDSSAAPDAASGPPASPAPLDASTTAPSDRGPLRRATASCAEGVRPVSSDEEEDDDEAEEDEEALRALTSSDVMRRTRAALGIWKQLRATAATPSTVAPQSGNGQAWQATSNLTRASAA